MKNGAKEMNYFAVLCGCNQNTKEEKLSSNYINAQKVCVGGGGNRRG